MLGCLCDFVHSLARPSVAAILEESDSSQVCTNIQCFGSLDDIVPLHGAASAAPVLWPFVAMLSLAVYLVVHFSPLQSLTVAKSTAETDKA